MRQQKTDEEIVVEKIDRVIDWLPALKNSILLHRAGTYFFCYQEERLIIGSCNKYTILGKVISDVGKEKLIKQFVKKYRAKGFRKLQDTIRK